MLILISQLIGRPVITFDEAEEIGVLRDPIIDPANGKLAGFFFGRGFMFMKQSAIAADDIVGYDDARVMVQNAEIARSIKEEPRIQKIVSAKTGVLGAKVFTESGRYLGRANDLLLDTELNMIVRYYVHGLLRDRIIPAEHVVEITKRGIIVDDTAPSAAAIAAEAGPS
jgi:uncharacterized protein YrrD